MKKKRIVFMGTADFAATILERLIASDRYELPFVVSQPDRPVGRKQILMPTAVKSLALAHGIAVEQPTKLRDGRLAQQLRDADVDLILTASYGRLLPVDVLAASAMPPINIHASLLPKFRGACPIQMAILEGESETGISFIEMVKEMDAGAVYRQLRVPISERMTSAQLFEILANTAAEGLIDFLEAYFNSELSPEPQDPSEVSFVRMLRKEDGALNFNETAETIDAWVRAFSDWPVTYSILEDRRIQILAGQIATDIEVKLEAPGTLVVHNKGLYVACRDAYYQLLQIKPAGSKIQDVRDVYHVYRSGQRFEFDASVEPVRSTKERQS
ncbi:MAG: methionyl-tRNA formyltransferase [Eubacteriales bacterium]|nr:methionyl-tRNA formyltransferase [Eubacteriales bacterium]